MFPSGAVLNCWGGGAVQTAFSGKPEDGLQLKSTIFTTMMDEQLVDHDAETRGAGSAGQCGEVYVGRAEDLTSEVWRSMEK